MIRFFLISYSYMFSSFSLFFLLTPYLTEVVQSCLKLVPSFFSLSTSSSVTGVYYYYVFYVTIYFFSSITIYIEFSDLHTYLCPLAKLDKVLRFLNKAKHRLKNLRPNTLKWKWVIFQTCSDGIC